jgi:hypothetical protein
VIKGYFLWMLLAWLTGSPLGAAVLLVVLFLVGDRVAFGHSRPLRWVQRRRRLNHLRTTIETNPHNRTARLELAEIYLPQRKYREALELLRPNFDAGDNDPITLYSLGLACYGAGFTEQGEQLFDATEDAEPGFRAGQVDLERGRWRLKNGDAAGALAPLHRFVEMRYGTVEGRVLLAKALAQVGHGAEAAAMRKSAWIEYVQAPPFKRKQERLWAWRANPARPAVYVTIVIVVVVVAGLLV